MVVGEIGAGGDPERAAALGDEAVEARRVGRLLAQQVGRDRALGEVVDAPPAAALDAHDLADVEQPLDRDLRLRPVPPLRARLRAAEVLRRQRAVGAQLLADRVDRGAVHLVPAALACAHPPPPEGEPGPLRLRQDRRRVRPVLEGVAAPVRVLDPAPARPGRAGHTRRARASGRAPRSCRAAPRRARAASRARRRGGPGRRQALRAQRDPPRLVRAQLDAGLRLGSGARAAAAAAGTGGGS